MAKITYVMTVPMSLRFIEGPMRHARELGHEATVIASPDPELDAFGVRYGVRTDGIPMSRKMSPAADARSLWQVAETIARIQPDIVHALTPKGGLLGITAASLAGVRGRLYHIMGLPFETATGATRQILRRAEQASCKLATDVLCVSRGVRQTAIDEGLVSPERIRVPGAGSSHGVDAARRFDPAARPAGERDALRAELGIPADATVAGFVGRLVRDKGVNELAEAWGRIRDAHPNAWLVVIGPYEPRDPVPEGTRRALADDPRVRVMDRMVGDIESFYGAMDLVVLPTYREGLPNVVLEAQAMALPVVGTTIPGCREGTLPGRSSLLVPAGDSAALAKALSKYVGDPELRAEHGAAGRAFVLEHFAPERLARATVAEYERILARG